MSTLSEALAAALKEADSPKDQKVDEFGNSYWEINEALHAELILSQPSLRRAEAVIEAAVAWRKSPLGRARIDNVRLMDAVDAYEATR